MLLLAVPMGVIVNLIGRHSVQTVMSPSLIIER